MNKQENYYELLGVDPEASHEEIRKAYHMLARQHHPDVAHGEGDLDKFKEITAAYDTLSDPEARVQYNKDNQIILRPPGSIPQPRDEDRHTRQEWANEAEVEQPGEDGQRVRVSLTGGFSGSKNFLKDLQQKLSTHDGLRVAQRVALTNPNDIPETPEEEELAPWAGGDAQTKKKKFDLRSLLTGKRRSSDRENRVLHEFTEGVVSKDMAYLREQQRKQLLQNNILPADEELKRRKRELYLGDEASEGSNARLDAPAAERVYQFQVTDYEASFGTTREVAVPDAREDREYSRIKIKIPAGIKQGTRMGVSRGWMRIVFNVSISPDPYYIVEGLHVYVKLPVSLQEAVFGALVPVKAPPGRAVVKIRQGDGYSKAVVLSGRGLQPKNSDPGDLYAQPYVVFPLADPEAVRDNLFRLKDSYTPQTASGIVSARTNPANTPFADVFIVPVTIPELLDERAIEGVCDGFRYSFSLGATWDGEPLESAWTGSSPGRRILPVLALPDQNQTILSDVAYRLDAITAQSPRSRMILVDS